jgi:hypothetical protein
VLADVHRDGSGCVACEHCSRGTLARVEDEIIRGFFVFAGRREVGHKLRPSRLWQRDFSRKL